MPLLLFLTAVSMVHAIPGSDPILKHVAKLVHSTKTDTSFRQIHKLTQQTQTQMKFARKSIQKYFYANVKSAAWKKNKISKSSRNITNGLKSK